MKKLYIIMINYNGIEDTKNCIESIYASNDGLLFIKTIIVDNDSNTENKKQLNEIKSTFKDVTIIFNKKNFGFAKANNIGLNYIRENYGFEDYSYIWFLNNDTLLNNSLLKQLEAQIINDNEVFYFEMRNFDNEIVNNGLNYLNPFFGRYRETYKKNYIEYICGASILLKNTEKVPFWNDEYFLYFEDVDYSLRLKKAGYNFKTIEGVWYNHKVNGSSSKNNKVNIFKLQSQKKFMKENGRFYFLFFLSKILYLLIKGKFTNLKYFI